MNLTTFAREVDFLGYGRLFTNIPYILFLSIFMY